MKAEEIFRKKQSYDLEKTVKLETAVGQVIEIVGAEVYTSSKFGSDFSVIEDSAGNLYFTWSAVVTEKVAELVALPVEEWQGLEVTVTKNTAESGFEYLNLELPE